MSLEGEINLDDLIKKERQDSRMNKQKQITKDKEERQKKAEQRKTLHKQRFN